VNTHALDPYEVERDIMRALARGPLTPGSLIDATSRELDELEEAADALEKRGLIEKHCGDMMYQLTDKGWNSKGW
jgi:predicted transcriptional regulator